MELVNNVYTIQGVELSSLAEQYGTPLFVYDGEKIANQYKSIKSAFSDHKLRIKYAAKALTNISILKYMRHLGCELDVVSIQEAHIGLKAGFKPNEILYTPNCVSFSEFQEAVELGLMVNIDNISILEQFGNKYRGSVPCCIRLNPHIFAGGNNKISTGHVDSKFGISIYQLPHLLKIVRSLDIQIVGLHMHTGSDILDSDVFLKVAEIFFSLARDFENLQFIDFGSGFKVKYREDDNTTNIFDLGKKLGSAFKQFCSDYGRDLEIWFEPGKFMVSEAGILLTRTNVVKTTPATVFAGVDSGMNHLIRPMMYEAYHDIVNISNPEGVSRIYTVVGYICETDTFGINRKLNEVREGDLLVIKNAGAYCSSMSSNYNSRPRAAEVFMLGGKTQLIKKRDGLEDIMRNMISIDSF